MKRKRGNKKCKQKKPAAVVVDEPAQNEVSLNTEDNSGSGDNENELESGMEVEMPSSTGTDQQEKLATVSSTGLVNKTATKLVYGRVKVRIKTSKALDSQITSSDAPTQSDTDKSSQQVGLERHVVGEKMEDSANSLPDMNTAVSGTASKQAGSIKIKSSKSFASSSINQCSNATRLQSEQTHHKEPGVVCRDPRYNEQELNASLEVIKKVMKMDAAEPFNAPVNPVALGIPDYFDVIDTPMDFGTICGNLESGIKYLNSEDVFKDVQYIWENCYKYNNKGDYVVELMKRVKKNFTKYWTAAGLYTDQSRRGVESIQSKDVAPSSNMKTQGKGGHSKQKTRKRHGVKKHKDDCLCAICVMMRRRQEREESAQSEDQREHSYRHLAQDVKPEEPSPAESPYGEDTSSDMDNSPGPDADADLEEKVEEVKLEVTEQLHSPVPEKQEEKSGETEIQTKDVTSGPVQPGESYGDKNNEENPTTITDSEGDMQFDAPLGETTIKHDYEAAAVEQQKPKELTKREKAKMFENFHHYENPMLPKLCGSLFPNNHRSAWSGPHSLVRRPNASRCSKIDEAIMMFMK